MEHRDLEGDRAGRINLFEEAARWRQVLNDDDVTAEQRLEFQSWLKMHPTHGEAYNSINEVWGFAQGSVRDPRVLQIRREMNQRLSRRYLSAARTRWLAVGAIAFAMVGLFVAVDSSKLGNGFLKQASVASPGTTSLRTAVGERVSSVLEDGSLVNLNTHSAVDVRFSTAERRVILAEGQAFFDVAKDAKKPFVVEVGGHEVVAVGTAFDVRFDRGQTQVTMKEGVVTIDGPVGSERSQAISLGAGEQLTIDASQVRHVRRIDVEAALSWNQGRVELDAVPLEDAVFEINRYSTTRIVIESPDLSGLLISGTFSAGRPQLFVDAVVGYFPGVRAINKGQEIVLTKEN